MNPILFEVVGLILLVPLAVFCLLILMHPLVTLKRIEADLEKAARVVVQEHE